MKYPDDEAVALLREEDFPITRNYLYLDHAGVSPVPVRAVDAANRFLTQASREGAFVYDLWSENIEGVRRACAELIGAASPTDVSFVKNTSHGISIVARGLDWKRGDNVVLVEGEFPANAYPWLPLKEKGVELRFVSQGEDGVIETAGVAALIDSRTRVLAISSVQYWSGFRADLEALGALCKGAGVYLLVDAIQSLGVVPMDVERYNVDFLAADGHKWLMAPEGTGIFYCREGLAERLDPPLLGWKSVVNESDYDHIDFTLKPNALKFEEGSLNMVGVYALGATVDLLLDLGVENVRGRVVGLGDLLISEALKRGWRVITPKEPEKRGGIVSFAGGFDPLYVKEKLRDNRVMVNVRRGALRVSPHFYNTADDIAGFFSAIDSALDNS